MKAQSADYIQLQNIYKSKARKDLAEITNIIRDIEETLNRGTMIEEMEIEAFCKGAAFVKLVRGNELRIADEPTSTAWIDRANYILQQLEDEDSLITINVALLALDHYMEKAVIPLTSTNDTDALDAEQRKLKWSMTQYTDNMIESLKKAGNSDADTEAAQERINKVIMEIARAGPSELHNISALTGGMVAQEVIKVLTKQYVPIDNTCVFDGITSKSAVFKL